MSTSTSDDEEFELEPIQIVDECPKANSEWSTKTLNKTFFNNLWPLILEENICDTHSKNTSQFFLPERQFDYLWAHQLLASKGYKNYQKPTELRVHYPEDDEVETPEPEEPEECTVLRHPEVFTLSAQGHNLYAAEQERQKLAYDFINRKFPWYMQRPIYHASFEIDDEVREQFIDRFEMRVLQSIKIYNCKLIIIDVGSDVVMAALERWLKFCRYAKILAVVRCEVIARQLPLLGSAFHTLLVQENLENTWQEELSRALDLSVRYAKAQNLFEDCTSPFVFVFSKKQAMCNVDSFKILKKP